ncbi:MAG: alpha/beta fold hydrolase [Candidatus Binatia bacterium]
MKNSYVSVNGIRINVSEWGGSGRELLFAHPTGFLGAVWEPVIRALRDRGFEGRVITFDQRGHGLSSKPDDGYKWESFVSDLEALMAALDLEGVVGVGHSGGATTIAGVAAANPARFDRLVLVDPILFDRQTDGEYGEMDNPMSSRTRTRRLVWPSRKTLFEAFAAKPPYDSWSEEALRAYVEYGTFERPDGEIELLCPGRIEAQVYANALASDGFSHLGSLAMPVVLVRGEQSDSFPIERARRALGELTQGRLIAMSDTTHFVPMERPGALADLILEEVGAAGKAP